MKIIKKISLENANSISESKYLVCKDGGVDVLLGSSDGSNINNKINIRAVYISNQLDTSQRLIDVKAIVKSSAESGFNAITLASTHFDNYANAPSLFKSNLVALKTFCDDWGIKIIPVCFSIGYAGSYTSKPINRNLAASYPCSISFNVSNGSCIVIPETDSADRNIDFESFTTNTFDGFFLQDGPGITSFLDDTVSYSGSKSCRFTDIQNSSGYGRLGIQIDVTPYKSYEVSFWAKASVDWPGQGITVQSTQTDTSRTLMSVKKTPTAEWTKYILQFNSLDCTQINVAFGVWGGTTGSFWVDDIVIKRQDQLQMVVKREKTPFIVKNYNTNHIYIEDVDYSLSLTSSYPDMIFTITPITIPNGTTISVDYYRAYWRDSWGGTHALCMDAEETQTHFDSTMDLIYNVLKNDYWQFSTDEIRQGGYDAESINKDMGVSLFDHLLRRINKAQFLNKDSRILISGDILYDGQNAITPYLSAKGFDKSWEKILYKGYFPVSVWQYATRNDAITHFKDNSYTYYASINIAECPTTTELNNWKTSISSDDPIIRYTTWTNDYSRLAEFAGVFF